MSEVGETFMLHSRIIELDGGRKVEAGRHDESWYIKFHNGEGGVHSVRISYDAANALMQLLTEPGPDIEAWTVEFKPASWQQIVEDAGALPRSPQDTKND